LDIELGELVKTGNLRIRRVVGLLLASLSFYSTLFLRVYWGPLAPYLEAEGVDRELVGLTGSLFFSGYVASQIPGGILADRRGPGFTMGLGLVISGSINALISVTLPSIWPLLSIATGIFAGTVYGPSIKLIRELFPDNTERAMGFYGISWALPFLVAPWLVPYIASTLGAAYAHVVSSITSISIGILDLVFLRDVGARDGNGLGVYEILRVLRGSSSRVALISIGGLLVLYYNWVIAYWLYYYMIQSGIDAVSASAAMSIFSISGIASMPLAGMLAEKMGLFRLLLTDLAIYSLSGIGVALSPNLPYVFLYAGALGVSRYITTPLNSSILARSFDEKIVATASSTVNMLWQMSGIAAPYVTVVLFKIATPGGAMLISALTPATAIIPYAILARAIRKKEPRN
jgi:MFS family permease